MKKIIIIGCSLSGVKIAEELFLYDFNAEITIISNDEDYPYDREMFPDLISGDSLPSQIFYKPKDFYNKNNIKFLFNKKISRVNLAKKKIFFEDKDQIGFDVLVIAEAIANKFSAIKGTHRLGLYGMRRLKDIYKILGDMPFFDSVFIQSDTFSGIRMADAFFRRGKDVVLILSGADNFFSSIDSDIFNKIKEQLLDERFSIIEDAGITELLGDKEIKAVRLSSGKVLAGEVVIIGEVNDDFKIFQKQQIEIKNGICVDEEYKTNVDSVYCIDNVVECAKSEIRSEDLTPKNILELQGHIVAQNILGNNPETLIEQDIKRISIKDISFVFIGDTHRCEGVSEITKIKDVGIEYEKIFVKQDVIVGAILINKDEQIEYLSEIIKNKVNINSVEINANKEERSFNYNQFNAEEDINAEQNKIENTANIINDI